MNTISMIRPAAAVAKQSAKEYYIGCIQEILMKISNMANIGGFKVCVDITKHIAHTPPCLSLKEQVENVAGLLRDEGFNVEVYDKDLVAKLLINWK